jgi:ribose/xylose/arabinose/galactoside ABC-type transport system permease subunit
MPGESLEEELLRDMFDAAPVASSILLVLYFAARHAPRFFPEGWERAGKSRSLGITMNVVMLVGVVWFFSWVALRTTFFRDVRAYVRAIGDGAALDSQGAGGGVGRE